MLTAVAFLAGRVERETMYDDVVPERRQFSDPTRGLFEEYAVQGVDGTGSAGELLLQLRRCSEPASEAAGERLVVTARLQPSRSKAKLWLALTTIGEQSGDLYPDLVVSVHSGRGSRARFEDGQERSAMELALALNHPARLPDTFYERFTWLSGVAPFACDRCPKLGFVTYSAARAHALKHHGETATIRCVRRLVDESPLRSLRRGWRLLGRRFRLGDVLIPEPIEWHVEKEGEGIYYAVSSVGSIGPYWSEEEVQAREVEITTTLAARRDARHMNAQPKRDAR
jgi:hypothetical protein